MVTLIVEVIKIIVAVVTAALMLLLFEVASKRLNYKKGELIRGAIAGAVGGFIVYAMLQIIN